MMTSLVLLMWEMMSASVLRLLSGPKKMMITEERGSEELWQRGLEEGYKGSQWDKTSFSQCCTVLPSVV